MVAASSVSVIGELFRGFAQFSSRNFTPDRILIIALKEDVQRWLTRLKPSGGNQTCLGEFHGKRCASFLPAPSL